MARIGMSSGFVTCPEGNHIFRIYDVEYKEDFGKIEVKMVTADGITHIERFNLLNANGSSNDKALNAFSYFAKTALNDFTLDEIDHTDIINHYIGATVVHTIAPSTKDPTKNVTFANLSDKWVASGFDKPAVAKALSLGTETQEAPKQAPASKPTESKGLDLDSLLG